MAGQATSMRLSDKVSRVTIARDRPRNRLREISPGVYTKERNGEPGAGGTKQKEARKP
jgi:hypothetical protein